MVVLYCLGSTCQVADPCLMRAWRLASQSAGSTCVVSQPPGAEEPPTEGECWEGEDSGWRALWGLQVLEGTAPLESAYSSPRTPGTRQREGVRPGREKGGAWPRAGRRAGGGAVARR